MGIDRTECKMRMDLQRNKKALGLIETFPDSNCTDDELSIWHLEKIITEVEPYGNYWFMGRIKALKHAISVLKRCQKKRPVKRVYINWNEICTNGKSCINEIAEDILRKESTKFHEINNFEYCRLPLMVVEISYESFDINDDKGMINQKLLIYPKRYFSYDYIEYPKNIE